MYFCSLLVFFTYCFFLCLLFLSGLTYFFFTYGVLFLLSVFYHNCRTIIYISIYCLMSMLTYFIIELLFIFILFTYISLFARLCYCFLRLLYISIYCLMSTLTYFIIELSSFLFCSRLYLCLCGCVIVFSVYSFCQL